MATKKGCHRIGKAAPTKRGGDCGHRLKHRKKKSHKKSKIHYPRGVGKGGIKCRDSKKRFIPIPACRG